MKRSDLILILLAALSLGGYLLASRASGFNGFPLDDAWIHQTYARNLAQRGEWAFIPGQPSAGSTAPLWSLLLAVGHRLSLTPQAWAFFLGWLLLAILAMVGARTFLILCPGQPAAWGWAAGALLALEWHLAWSAGSGMETLLLSCLALAALTWLARSRINWFGWGALAGLCAWVRPDGITLLGPGLLVILLEEQPWPERFKQAAWLAAGVACLIAPYLIFNRSLAGAFFPNTYFAKQAEYASWRQAPLVKRLLDEAVLPLTGVGALLLPGYLYGLTRFISRRQWGWLAGALWPAGYILLYAVRLPVTYQHGRYIIPAMPVLFIWGTAGIRNGLQAYKTQPWQRILGRAWLASTTLVLFTFWIIGAWAYARDVGFIDSEMVAAARWVASNTTPGSLVAAHDIGALGYFGQRPLLDMAGLVSPQVIPFIRDEARLEQYLDESDVSYLVTLQDWYPHLIRRGQLLYQNPTGTGPSIGGQHMNIYLWNPAH